MLAISRSPSSVSDAPAGLAHQRHAQALFQFRDPVRQRRAGHA
jgi:hypothetical protein